MILTRNQLSEISDHLGKNISDWSLFDIVTAWRCLENMGRDRLTTGGWNKKLDDMKAAFKLMNVPTMDVYKKELNTITSHFIKERIDTAPEPEGKRGANLPPYYIWRQVIVAIENEIKHKKGTKKLRAAQGHLLLCWTLATGARLEELLRLRKSDLTSIMNNNISCIKITVRRSKRSRDGKKPIFYYAHENKIVPEFCPIAAFYKYASVKVEGVNIFSKRSDLVFPKACKVLFGNDLVNTKDSTVQAENGHITYKWNRTCERLKLKPEWWIEAHSGRVQIINNAWANGHTDEQLLDITNWSSTRVLPEYVSGPSKNAINVLMTQMTVEELDNKCRHLLQQ